MNEIDGEQLTIAPDGRPQSAQPRWRRDFPIDWAEDHYVARRDFTKFMVLTSLAFAAGQVWIGFQSLFRRTKSTPARLEVARVDGVSVGSSMVFGYPDERSRCVLVRLGEDNFVAYSQECTHLSCAVVPEVEQGRFRCPCHEGLFDIATGRPLAGPPRRPLPQIKVEIKKGVIYATGFELRTL
jgi:Rieske Fe-S protein